MTSHIRQYVNPKFTGALFFISVDTLLRKPLTFSPVFVNKSSGGINLNSTTAKKSRRKHKTWNNRRPLYF